MWWYRSVGCMQVIDLLLACLGCSSRMQVDDARLVELKRGRGEPEFAYRCHAMKVKSPFEVTMSHVGSRRRDTASSV